MAGFEVKTIEEYTSYPLGRFVSLNRMEYQFWMDERVRQNAMLEQIEQNNPGLKLGIPKDIANNPSAKFRATSFNVEDVDVLARVSDSGKGMPADTEQKLKRLGDLRKQNKFLGNFVVNFDEYCNDLNLEFKDENHKEQTKMQMEAFYKKRNEAIGLMKNSISKDLDKAGYPPFGAKGRQLMVDDTYNQERRDWTKTECVKQGLETLSEREAERAVEEMFKEIEDNNKKIEEQKLELAEKEKQLKELEEKKKESEVEDITDFEPPLETIDEELEEQKEKEKALEEIDPEVKKLQEEMQKLTAQTEQLIEHNRVLQDEIDIIQNKTLAEREGLPVEITENELRDGPGKSLWESLYDGLAKLFSIAWAGLTYLVTPAQVTENPEKPHEFAKEQEKTNENTNEISDEKEMETPNLNGPFKK
jgi:DNA repair exonuclease SbcCD ATPase subunit